MSRERARRREQRIAAQVAAQARRDRVARRREFRRALVRRITPRPGRRAWLLGRRSPGKRAAIVAVVIGLLWLIWYEVASWPLRIAFTLLVVLVVPVLVVVTFDRRV